MIESSLSVTASTTPRPILPQGGEDDHPIWTQIVNVVGNQIRLQLVWSSLNETGDSSSASNSSNLYQNGDNDEQQQSFDVPVPLWGIPDSEELPPRRLRIILQPCRPPISSTDNSNNNNNNTISVSPQIALPRISSTTTSPTRTLEAPMEVVPSDEDEDASPKNFDSSEVDGPAVIKTVQITASYNEENDDDDDDDDDEKQEREDDQYFMASDNELPLDDDGEEEEMDCVDDESPSLHDLFQRSSPSPHAVTLDEVLHVLEQDPSAASMVDSTTGQLPLHVISEHDELLQHDTGRTEATRIVRALIQAYPPAMTMTDAQGNMPFVSNLKLWVANLYEEEANHKQQQQQAAFTTTSSLVDKLMLASLTPIAKLRGSTSTWSSPDPTLQNHGNGSLHRNSTLSTHDSHHNNNSHTSISHSLHQSNNSPITMNQSNSNHQQSNQIINNSSGSNQVGSLISRTLNLPVPDITAFGASKVTATRMFPMSSLTDKVIWSLEMLSLCLDEMAESKPTRQQQDQPVSSRSVSVEQPSSSKSMTGKSRDVIRESRMALATNVLQQVPLLIKSMLLLEDSTLRERVWSLSIARQMLVNETAIGPWLTPMLRRHGLPSQRVIDFFVLVSESKVEDVMGTVLTPLPEDIQAFESEQRRVFEAVEALGETIPSLALLNEPKEIERAATTSVVWFVMNKELSSPFTVGLILVDLVLHVTLLLSFRSQVNLPRKGTGTLLSNVPVGIVLTICAHYMIRKITEGVALLNISPVLMRRYFWNLWRLLDLGTILITVVAVCLAWRHLGQYRPSLNALVLFLLWMKVLGFLKVVNRETATFILSLFEIIKDIRNFMLVLLVIILMFADMLHVLITTDDQHFCNQPEDHLDGSQIAFCSPALIDGYLRAYVILMNNFDLQSFRETNAITLVFILYTLLGSIIMLNVLIAVVNESYEKSRVSSALLFGRARVGFVAEHTALEQFLQPGRNPFEQLSSISSAEEKSSAPSCGRYFQGLAVAGRWLVLLSLLGTAASSLVYLVGKAVVAPKVEKSFFVTIVFAVLSILLTMAMLVVTHSCFAGLVTGLAPRAVAQRVVAAFDFPAQHITRFVSVHLFGLTGAPPPVGLIKTFRLIHRGGHDPSPNPVSS